MRMLVIDHNDSFTFNLVDAFRVLGCAVDVVQGRHCEPFAACHPERSEGSGQLEGGLREAIQCASTGLPRRPGDLLAMTRLYDALVLSPGPGRPADYPETRALLDLWPADRPLLGVCLGMQLLNEWSGGETIHAPQVVHGKTCPIFHDGRGLFGNLPNPCTVMRYHSLACKITSPDWNVCARSEDDVPMAMYHRTRPWWGVQFHPESFMTPDGPKILQTFVKYRLLNGGAEELVGTGYQDDIYE